MASAPLSLPPLVAADVCRGITRLFLRHELVALAEVPLDGGRRADLMAIDARGCLVIVEIKVSRADLLGDGKW
ncbi:MmcB family DNA repair protein, partial [Klebsiella pneumoniae]|nr:MmcB family DNA repair protein [Klebsiella pneumoniae]